ncbi:calcium/calmodulin-dependent 3',5'-cyclic nucleotide phosphodiesterase 1B [Haematococcus lacustris]|uniref:Calcium/calmodulin-dependent 3',5'-cyclic nucleotide phosphodiesterase 1B n=1 Tax=Haematococcus lacustris TaxID=44745 RepID=A0A699YZG9_HAELA|nr:calcium/calmodulin-dependent 3',5'-cyclic nucleotide phosphodiesterase 1B [Haematococcus lacustris]
MGAEQQAVSALVGACRLLEPMYPETPITTQQLGINIFDGFYRMETLASLTTKRFKVAGPYRQPGDNRLYTTVSAPVLFANVSNAETWGIPYTIDDCPVGLCYDTVTRTKLWGSVAITLDVDAIITDSNNRSILQQLTDSGLQYRLKAPSFGNDSLTATIYESTDGDMSSSSLHEHRALLRSLLPEEAIQKLQANFDWAADAMDENKPQAMLESGTPAEMILSIMGDIVVGRAPALPKVMAVRHTLQQSLDVYQPLQADLSTRIAQTENIDSEVHEALMVQLMGRKAKAEPEEGEDTFNTEAFNKGEGGAAPAPATTRARGRGSRTSVPRITATAAPAAGQAAASAATPISPTKPFKLGAAGPDPGSVSPPKAAVPQPGTSHGAHQALEAKHTAGTGSGQGSWVATRVQSLLYHRELLPSPG